VNAPISPQPYVACHALLKYLGCKYRLSRPSKDRAKHPQKKCLLDYVPASRVYVEPFCGAAGSLLNKPPSPVEVLSDMSWEIVELIQVMGDQVLSQKLRDLISAIPYSGESFAGAWKNRRRNLVERAAATLVKSYMGNYCEGLFRETTGFRKPTNGEDAIWQRYPNRIPLLHRRLRGVTVMRRDALQTIASTDSSDTLFNVDPPYVHESERDTKQKYKYEMTDEQHEELADVLHSVRGMAIVSGYRTKLYERLYPDWPTISMQHIANAAKRAEEILWMSPRTYAAWKERGSCLD